MKCFLFLFLVIIFACCPDGSNRPTYSDPGNNGKPTSASSFVEIANNPDSNSYQLHTIRLMMDFVKESNVELAYLKLLETEELLLDFRSLRFVYDQEQSGKKYCSGSIDINNYIQDISPISEFHNITTLNLSDNNIKNIEPLESMTELKVLKINNNKLKDIRIISQLINSEELELTNNQINDFSPILELTKLKYLSIGGNNSKDFSVLQPLIENGLKINTDSDTNISGKHANDQQQISNSIPGRTIGNSNKPILFSTNLGRQVMR